MYFNRVSVIDLRKSGLSVREISKKQVFLSQQWEDGFKKQKQ